jgi:hypothetical protein
MSINKKLNGLTNINANNITVSDSFIANVNKSQFIHDISVNGNIYGSNYYINGSLLSSFVGPTGATGSTGAQGPQGAKGDKGDKGNTGNDGNDGKDSTSSNVLSVVGSSFGVFGVAALAAAVVVIQGQLAVLEMSVTAITAELETLIAKLVNIYQGSPIYTSMSRNLIVKDNLNTKFKIDSDLNTSYLDTGTINVGTNPTSQNVINIGDYNNSSQTNINTSTFNQNSKVQTNIQAPIIKIGTDDSNSSVYIGSYTSTVYINGAADTVIEMDNFINQK